MSTGTDRAGLFGWSTALVGFGALARKLGCDPQASLSGFGLDETIERPPGFPASTAAMFGALARLADQSGRADVALGLLRYQTTAVLGSLWEAVRRQPDLGRALGLFNQAIHMRATGYVPSLERADDSVIARFSSLLPAGPMQDLQLDYNMGSVVLAVRELVGPQWCPELVELTRAKPAQPHFWNDYFGCPVRFAADECLILFDAGDLARPLASADGAEAGQLAHEGSVPIDFATLVDREIIRNFALGIPGLHHVARALGVTERTVQRRLARAGTSYQQRLGAIRMGWAQQRLAHSRISLTELSQMLGFADLATFSRTFKRWFGMSPRSWRAGRREAPVGISQVRGGDPCQS